MKVRLSENAIKVGHKHVGHLVPGREYVVLEVYARPDRLMGFRVEESIEPYKPFIAEADALELISDELPSCWRASLSNDHLSFQPARWRDAPFENGFWSEFFDGNRKAMVLYREVRDEIYREGGVEPPDRPDWMW
jgi:hypothetical protein